MSPIYDTFIPVRYLPDWMPGASFKQTARAWKQTLGNMVDNPYKFVREQMVRNCMPKYLH